MSTGEQLTDEDIATLRRCRQLSFWRGSVPFTIGSVLVVGTAQRMGFFVKRPRLAIPSYILATLFGYLGGKVTYLGECKRMFMELNDSRIKDQLMSYSPYVSGYRNDADPDDPSSPPMIVNTPTRPTSPQQSSDSSRPLSTYADRRNFYRSQSPNQAPSNPERQSTVDSTQEEQSSQSFDVLRDSYFDKDRPFSSYQFDDNYRPRDD